MNVLNILAPGVMEQHLSVGFSRAIKATQELSLAVTRAFAKKVTGPNPLEAPGLQSIGLERDERDIELGWSFGIRR